MNKSAYYILVTVLFVLVTIPTVTGFFAEGPAFFSYIDRSFIKWLLIVGICAQASYLIKNTLFKFVGLFSTFILFIGLQWKTMHWPLAKEVIIISGLLVLTDILVSWTREKNENILDYLLLIFVLQRLLIVLFFPPDNLLWWIDVVICFVIAIAGCSYIYKMLRNKRSW